MLANLVLENTNSPGTGSVTPAGAPSGRLSFASAFSAGAQAWYVLTDGSQTEEGWTTVGSTLARNVIWTSSGGLTSTPLNFTGSCQIYSSLPAQRTLWGDTNGNWDARGRLHYNLGTAGYADQAPRMDQIGQIRTALINANGNALVVPFPAIPGGFTTQKVVIELRRLTCAASASYYFRLSIDGAASYLSGLSEYKYSLTTANNGVLVENNGVTSYSPISAVYDATSAAQGRIVFDAQTHQWDCSMTGVNSGNGKYSQDRAVGNSSTQGNVTHMVVSAVGQALTGGQAVVSQVLY